MNKKLFILLPVLSLMLAGCVSGDKKDDPKPSGDDTPAEVVTVESVELNQTTATLDPGDTLDLKAVVKPATLTERGVNWSSDAEAVATVSAGGRVTAVAAGTAKIKATAKADSTKFAECTITVNKKMIIVASEEPALNGVFKLGTYQGNVKKYFYFKGSVNSDTRGEVADTWEGGVDVKVEKPGEAEKYALTFTLDNAKKYFEMTDDHHYRIADSATLLWDWNADICSFTRTISGTTYFPGTYSNYDTISGCDIKQVAGDFVFQLLYKVEPTTATSIEIRGENEIVAGATLQLSAKVGPIGASQNPVTWAVSGNDKVTINQETGLLTADKDAVVGSTAKVTARVDNLTSQEFVVTVLKAYDYTTEFEVTDLTKVTLPSAEADASELYLVGYIKEITNETFGNGTLVTPQGTEVVIYGMYNFDGEYRYDKMSTKPVAGDVIVLYGKTFLYGGKPEIKNGKLMQLNGVVCEAIPATAMAISPALTELQIGTDKQLEVKASAPSDGKLPEGTVTWVSDHPEFLEVSATGLLHPVAEGTAKITATLGELVAEMTVEVKPAPAKEYVKVAAPVKDTKYYMAADGRAEATLNKMCWLNGNVSGNYVATVADVADAAQFELVEVTGGYNVKVTYSDNTVKYMNVVTSNNGKTGSEARSYQNVKFEATATTVWTFNADASTLFTEVTAHTGDYASGNGTYYLGTYYNKGQSKAFDTLSLSKISNITGDNASKIDVSQGQFPVHFYSEKTAA